MRKLVLLVSSLALLMLAALPALAQDDAVEGWVCPLGYEGQTLSVFNWSTYIAEDTIPNFEAACGVTVLYDVYESNESMLSIIRAGNPGYDIVVPTGNTAGIMVEEELLIPLNYDLIPNAVNLSEGLRNPVYDPGNVYTMPYLWGTTALGVNVTNAPAIRTWDDVWAYEGNVAWLEDPRIVIGVALMKLGYDPNSENPDEIAEARDYLVANGGNVVAIAADDGQVLLERGDVDITIEYVGDILQLIAECQCDDYAYIVPEDGANIFTDNLAVPVGAPNADLAMIFIDYLYDPFVAAGIANFTAYATPNQLALDMELIDPAALANPAIYPDQALMMRLWPALTVAPEAEQAYNDAWDEIKVLLGR